MAALNSITAQSFLHLSTANPKPATPHVKSLSGSSLPPSCFRPSPNQNFSRAKQREWVVVGSMAKELDVIPVQSSDSTDQQDGMVSGTEREVEGGEIVNQVVGGFGSEGRLSFEGAGEFQGFSSSASSSTGAEGKSVEEDDLVRLIDRTINATIVLAAGTFAITKLLTIDQNYWHEVKNRHEILTNLYTSTLKDGIKRFESAVSMILVFVQFASPLPLAGWNYWPISPAEAVLYSPDTKVPRTGELALRRAIPANTNMKAIQDSLEDISYLLRIPQRKPYGTMEGNVKKALEIAANEREPILTSIPADLREKGLELYASLMDGKGGLKSLLASIKDQDPDKVSMDLASSLDTIGQLELLQAPGLSFLLPEQYLKYPRLTGRGIVEFFIEKGDGSAFSPEAGGVPRNTAIIQVVLDGYSAPLTAGNFAKLVVDGAYNGVKLRCTEQAILSDNGVGKNSGYNVPLEIKPAGQFEPLYKTTLSVQDGELPVLPLSVYGAVAMAHSEVSEEYSSPYQFFFYLFDKRSAGLGGLSFDEGQFSVFGYITIGREILPQIKTGDVIRSAKLVDGRDRLKLPDEN